MFRRRTRKILCFIFTLLVSIVSVFSSFSVFAVGSSDPSRLWSTEKPEAVRSFLWLRRSYTSAFQFEFQNNHPTISFPSLYRFLVQGDFYSSSSFSTGLAQTLTYINMETPSFWSSDYVYSVDIVMQIGQLNDLYTESADFSKILLVLPVVRYDDLPLQNFTSSQFSTYFYDGYVPVSVVALSDTVYRFTYNIAVYPETTFSRSVFDQGVTQIDGFAIYDSGSGVVRSTYDTNESAYRYHEYYQFFTLNVNIYTPDQFTNLSIQKGFSDIESAISDSTDAILSGDSLEPSNIASIISQHEVVEDIESGLLSTYPYQSVAFTGFMNSFDIDNFTVGLNHVSNWYDHVYNNCEVIFVLVWLYLGLAITVLSFRIIF